MAQQKVPDRRSVSLDRSDDLDESGMARIHDRFLFPPGHPAGVSVACKTGLAPQRRAADQRAEPRPFLRIGEDILAPGVKDDGADSGKLVKIAQKHLQLCFLKDGEQSWFPPLFRPTAACGGAPDSALPFGNLILIRIIIRLTSLPRKDGGVNLIRR